MFETILIVLLILMVLGALPTWGYTSNYVPSGAIGLILIVLLILIFIGRV